MYEHRRCGNGVHLQAFSDFKASVLTMKKNIDKKYWLELQQRIVDSGFVTITINPLDGKEYWKTTPKGIKALQQVVQLTRDPRCRKHLSTKNS